MLQGIFPVIPTLFTDDDIVDSDAVRSVVQFAIKAGARSAIGTLWKVNDAAAAELMIGFYRQLQDPTLSKAIARFANVEPRIHVSVFVRNDQDLGNAVARIREHPGLVIHTLADPILRANLEEEVDKIGVPIIPALDMSQLMTNDLVKLVPFKTPN